MFLRDKNQSAAALQSILNTIGGSIRLGAGWIMPRRADGWDSSFRRTRYSGEQLRQIRAKKGVGRRKGYAVWSIGVPRGIKAYPALFASVWDDVSPNYAEWLRKPRRKDRSAA